MTQGLAVDTIRIASIYASLVHAKDCSAHQSEDSPDDLVFQISKCTAIPSADEWVERMSDTSSSALEIAVHIWGLNCTAISSAGDGVSDMRVGSILHARD